MIIVRTESKFFLFHYKWTMCETYVIRQTSNLQSVSSRISCKFKLFTVFNPELMRSLSVLVFLAMFIYHKQDLSFNHVKRHEMVLDLEILVECEKRVNHHYPPRLPQDYARTKKFYIFFFISIHYLTLSGARHICSKNVQIINSHLNLRTNLFLNSQSL